MHLRSFSRRSNTYTLFRSSSETQIAFAQLRTTRTAVTSWSKLQQPLRELSNTDCVESTELFRLLCLNSRGLNSVVISEGSRT